jgi:hypothetical protein
MRDLQRRKSQPRWFSQTVSCKNSFGQSRLELPSRSSRRKCMFPTDRESNSANGPLSYHPLTTTPTKMVQTSFAFMNLSPSKCFISSSDAKELAKSVMDMRVGPEASRGSQFICSHTPPSEATSTEPCSPTPSLAFPENQPLQVVTIAQQFLGILKSLSTQQGPPPKSPDLVREAEGAKTDPLKAGPASKPEFKTVNEVYVCNRAYIKPCQRSA